MILYKDVVCRVVGNEQGCSLVYAKIINHDGPVPLAMGGRRGNSTAYQTVTQTNAPWAAQDPYLKDIFAQAQGQAQKPNTFFPGQTFANFSPQTEQALNLTEQRAMSGSPLNRLASDQLSKTLSGEYLHGGQGFNAALDAARNRILPDIESRFARSGRYGSGLAREAEARALGDSFAGQYAQERANQLNAMQFAPHLAETDYADINRLGGVGAARQAQEQAKIDEAMQRHAFEQMEPSQRLARYMQMIQGNYGGTNTTDTPYTKKNKLAGILGGAISGASAGAPAGAWGIGIGAGLGALSHLL